jgi:16S rRNA pseudouridine516 synthase
MTFKTTRLDRFIHRSSDFSIADARLLIAQNRIVVDGLPAESVQQRVTALTEVMLDGRALNGAKPVYLMLNKPEGVVSATKDPEHATVMDLIEHPAKEALHIVGRLDFNTTGLMLLTNDGAWSRKISLPVMKRRKIYEVTVSVPMNEAYISAFQSGLYFAYEGLTTQPADLEIVSPLTARLSLVEGRYHQVKRMFGHFQNKVLALHRISVGSLTLGGLEVGDSRLLTPYEAKEVIED